MSGYVVGPTLQPGEAPFAERWEQSSVVDDGHAHEWESVLIPPAAGRRLEEVVRCASCRCPRCGASVDEDPCMERRHHRGMHLYLSGRFDVVGGLLPEETGRA